jgi:hypothetical protein
MTTMTFADAAPPSKGVLWTGRVATTIVLLFLAFDITMKFLQTPEAIKGTADLGWPPNVALPLGIIQLVLLALYFIPRTSVLGAVLWTGYLGGAVAAHVRINNPLFTHTLFPVYVAILLWGGLWCRERRVRAFLFG